MALMTTMFFTMLMLMLAAALVTNASTETQISANHVARQLTRQAFYAITSRPHEEVPGELGSSRRCDATGRVVEGVAGRQPDRHRSHGRAARGAKSTRASRQCVVEAPPRRDVADP